MDQHTIATLFNDTLQDIFLYLEPKDVYKASQVCQQWQTAVIGGGGEVKEMNILWYRLFVRDLAQHLSEETMNDLIQDSRKLSNGTELNKGQLQRMRRNKKHKKKSMKKDENCESFHHQFRVNELVRYWERMYWYHLEKMNRNADLKQKLTELQKDACCSYLCPPNWHRIVPTFCYWRRTGTGSECCDLQFEETVEDGVTKHTVHCTKCKVAMSTTELDISKKNYSDFYGQHRAKFYPLKLLPISVFNYDTLDGEIHPIARGQNIDQLARKVSGSRRFLLWEDQYDE